MNNYAVLGLGLMGEAIVFDVLTHDKSAIVHGFEISNDRRKHLESKFSSFGKRFKTYYLQLDISTPFEGSSLTNDLSKNDVKVVYGAIDYKFNVYLTKLCIMVKASYFDLGGNPDIVRSQQKLDEEAKAAGITVIPDLGLAPGMANIIASHMMNKFDEIDECHIRVGGLPQPEYKKTILNYQQVFSIRGLTNEYLEDGLVIRDGKIQKVKSMTEVEELKFDEPYGWLEAFQTSGGTSSLPELFEGKINSLTYKTIRYPGHAQFFKFLIDFELLSSDSNSNLGGQNPREVVEYYLQKNLPKGDPDVVLVRITVSGQIKGSEKLLQYDLIDNYDPQTQHTAMARTTSYPISIIGQMVANGIIKQRGVIFSEKSIPEAEFMKQLSLRNIKFEITETDIN